MCRDEVCPASSRGRADPALEAVRPGENDDVSLEHRPLAQDHAGREENRLAAGCLTAEDEGVPADPGRFLYELAAEVLHVVEDCIGSGLDSGDDRVGSLRRHIEHLDRFRGPWRADVLVEVVDAGAHAGCDEGSRERDNRASHVFVLMNGNRSGRRARPRRGGGFAALPDDGLV